MTSAKDDEAFWNSSEKLCFRFDNNEVDQFGVSKTDIDKLLAGISNTSTAETSLKSTANYQPLKPMLSIISEKTLDCTMDKLKNLHPETSSVQPDITLRKILLGQPYSLEQYKSLASKIALLDAAIISGDGNAILIIILFLTKTLKRSLVQKILSERLDAVNVYIRYLSIRLQINEITDILTMLGQSTDSAMKTLHIIIKNTRDTDRLLNKLRNCYKTQFSALAECKEAPFVQSYIKLLEWQKIAKVAEGNEEIELNSSVLDCLRHACKSHWDLPEGKLMSPTNLSQQYDVSPRQYQKVALEVRATAKEWDDIDRLLLTKARFILRFCNLIKTNNINVLKILYKNSAPPEVLEKYLKYVDNIERRLELSKNMQCFRMAIDILVQQADRIALTEYKIKLQPQSEEYFYAEGMLRMPAVKWKN
ncbi:Spermatogenesis-defective protein 39 like protein [Melipona quadrifasciata]|uniref:Spermatogenesis-defective protein 39 like protein n=1 Tax=Melipona quadrifasciata TaxID=166423 RepID=A0A0N0BED5_9HYME|nr:Spermatogenesis-defective protein 39 like protein [Melipona quadrifasciata]